VGAFHRFAVFTVARDTAFVAVAGATLMLAFSFAPALALSIGGHIALLFAIGLLLRAACLSEQRIERTEAWRILEPQERPSDDAGRRSARDDLQEVTLRFAEGGAAAAILLFCASLSVSLTIQSRSLNAVVSSAYG
jgi:hypothetical protein